MEVLSRDYGLFDCDVLRIRIDNLYFAFGSLLIFVHSHRRKVVSVHEKNVSFI